jgi:hypothetical protein
MATYVKIMLMLGPDLIFHRFEKNRKVMPDECKKTGGMLNKE